ERGFTGTPPANTSTNATNRAGNTGGNGPFPAAGNSGPINADGNGGQRQPQGGPGGGGGGLFDIGNPGPLRLFTQPLAGQIVWLLPLALFGILALAWQRRLRLQEDWQQQSL